MRTSDPEPTPFSRGDAFAVTSAEAASFDTNAIARVGVPQTSLMENAGRAVASVLHRLYPDSPVVGVIGSGNNGGDGLVALRTLASWGHPVRAILAADRTLPDPLLHGWAIDVVEDVASPEPDEWGGKSGPTVVLDGVLGTGIRGAPRARQAAAIEWINRSRRPVVAIDVPSGVDSTTGETPGVAVRADLTIALGAPRVGSLLHPGRALAGRHVAVEIGFPPMRDGDAGAEISTPAWALARLPLRNTDTHKNAVGRLLVVGGQKGMGGAVILAANAAFRTGGGLVRIAGHGENRAAVHGALPEAIFVDLDDEEALREAVDGSDAIVAGPGLGTSERARTALSAVCSSSLPLLLDADALNLAAGGAVDLTRVSERGPVLVTPHPGEMSRLMPESTGSTLQRASAAAEAFGATVLLKGAPSVVCAPGALSVIDTQSSSDLAVAGMGDTLAGACGALLAQRLAPRDAGAIGLYLCGRAARIAGRGRGLVPGDVASAIPDAIAERPPRASSLDLPFVTFDAEAAR